MGDLHYLPLLGHDMPRRAKEKPKVFKEAGRWTWEHGCGDIYRGGHYHHFWELAFREALHHLEVCR